MSGRRGYVQIEAGGGADPLTAPTPPTQGPPDPVGTASVSLTWTHPTAPASGITYALTATDTATGDPVTPSSGSGLGPWVLPTSDGQGIVCTLTVTRTSDGQEVPSLPYYASVESSGSIPGAWTKIGDVNFVGATAQTFTTTGDKTVTLANASTVTVNASMSVGTITTGTAGVDATRGLIADVPGAVGSTAYRLRAAIPVSPSVGSTDDVLVLVRWRVNMATATSTFQRALVGITTASGSEASAEFSGGVLQNSTGNAVKLQSRKSASVADVAASVPSGWRDGTTLVQTDVRVVGKARTLFATGGTRNPDSGSATYTADIGGDSSGPNVGLEAPLFSGSTIYVQFYNWNGGASGPATSAAIERIQIFERTTSRVP